jgi:hypothetical protein
MNVRTEDGIVITLTRDQDGTFSFTCPRVAEGAEPHQTPARYVFHGSAERKYIDSAIPLLNDAIAAAPFELMCSVCKWRATVTPTA